MPQVYVGMADADERADARDIPLHADGATPAASERFSSSPSPQRLGELVHAGHSAVLHSLHAHFPSGGRSGSRRQALRAALADPLGTLRSLRHGGGARTAPLLSIAEGSGPAICPAASKDVSSALAGADAGSVAGGSMDGGSMAGGSMAGAAADGGMDGSISEAGVLGASGSVSPVGGSGGGRIRKRDILRERLLGMLDSSGIRRHNHSPHSTPHSLHPVQPVLTATTSGLSAGGSSGSLASLLHPARLPTARHWLQLHLTGYELLVPLPRGSFYFFVLQVGRHPLACGVAGGGGGFGLLSGAAAG